MEKIKETHLAIGAIGTIVIIYLILSFLLKIQASEAIVFGAFTAIAGLAGFESRGDK